MIRGEFRNFYEYLLNKGYYFNQELIESFLLSIKVTPFLLLVGKPGCGKSTLPKLFSAYLSENSKKEDIVINAVNSLGKSYSNKEWHLKRDTIAEILPILPFEGKECKFTINDSFTSVGKLKLDPRFRFSDKRLINHLLKLQEENPEQNLNLKIKVGEKSIDSTYFSIYDIKNELDLFKKSNEDTSSLLHKLLKNSNKNKDINYFLIVENLHSYDENNFLELLNIIKFNSNFNNLFVIGTVNTDDLDENFSLAILDKVNVIELENMDIGEYISANFDPYPDFNDLNYLEFKTFDNVSKGSITEINKIFSNICANGSNLLSQISNELTLFNNVFIKMGCEISLKTVNDILKFMIVSWKYEGAPNEWYNWDKYFDIQIKQKLLPMIKNPLIYSNAIGDLLKLCCKYDVVDVNNKEDIKYCNSYLKLKNMEKSLNLINFSYFNCFHCFKDIESIKFTSSSKNSKSNKKNSNKGAESKYGSNIYKYGEFFVINKNIKRKNVNFGKFESLSDAIFVKNILIENDWKLSRIRNKDAIYFNDDRYWIIKVFGGKIVILGKFNSYDDASDHIEWLITEFKNNEDFKIYIPKKQELVGSFNEEIVEDLSGWPKLVFNAIVEVEKRVFSLNDLKVLDLFEMYQFEDQSLDGIINANLNKLVDLKLIEYLGSGFYKK